MCSESHLGALYICSYSFYVYSWSLACSLYKYVQPVNIVRIFHVLKNVLFTKITCISRNKNVKNTSSVYITCTRWCHSVSQLRIILRIDPSLVFKASTSMLEACKKQREMFRIQGAQRNARNKP